MSDFVSLKEQRDLLVRVVDAATKLRTLTATWIQVTQAMKDMSGKIVDEQLYNGFPTFSTQAFSDIVLGLDFPTVECLVLLPDTLKLDVGSLEKEPHRVHSASREGRSGLVCALYRLRRRPGRRCK